MKLFQLVKITLDSLYQEAMKEHANETDKRIAESIRYLSVAYTQLTDASRELVNYENPVTRFAYVYMYVAAHADYLTQLIEAYRSDLGSPIFKTERLRLSCIGGGPGSDFIAVVKYLSEHTDEPVEKVTAYLVDGEQGWADTWTELDGKLDLPFQLATNFQPLDVTRPNSWTAQKKFLEADVFTISYFVSEVMSLDRCGVVTDFWSKVFSNAKSGTLFFYIDNGAQVFNDYFDRLWNTNGLKLISSFDNQRKLPGYDEEKSELGDFLTKFGRNPKVQAQLSGRILVKP
ncbi:hypothetical protein ACQR53_10080 [Xanthomonas oryzae]|uniref:hypothetical protein n=1 Tax=Xanthomonas oryzae TaxID=347 RepID=UPI001033A5E4|nr:hypothetical protein [Xanthomonas oryzae]QBG88225.1 hypothetical protein EYC54_11395 [Xanthomonas oryzae]